MKEALCRAFCDSLEVSDVPAGLAVRTAFINPAGDHVGFYVLSGDDGFRIEDSGTVLPELEAHGLDFRSGSRGEAMSALLKEYAVNLDPDDRLFAIDRVRESDLASAALRFVAFLLRVSDFALMTEARIVSTFREDVKRRLAATVGAHATIEESAPILPDLSDFPADFVLRARDRPPVGVYIATGDEKVLQALWVQMRVLYETHDECSIIALAEGPKTLTAPVRQQAGNRLNAVAYFRGDETASIERIAREALGARLLH